MNEQAASLIDIVEPAVPQLAQTADWLWIAVLLGLLLLLLIVLLLLWKKKWPAYRALKRLQLLKQQTQSGEIAAGLSIYLLAQELELGLGLDKLTQEAPASFASSDRVLWPVFMQHLDMLRYQNAEELSYSKLSPLFGQTESWLRLYCRLSLDAALKSRRQPSETN